MYLNKIFLIGNLTRDPELKSLPSGTKVTTFGMATNRVWKDANGTRQEGAEYHNLVVFGRSAEVIKQYMRKGSSIFVEGRIQTRSWDGQDGVKKYRTEIVVEAFQFGPKPAGAAGATPAREPGTTESATKEKPTDLDTIEYPDEEINLEDIPF